MADNTMMNEAELVNGVQHGLYLTPEGYKSLQSELEHLTLVKRPEIADRIRESQQHGEFSEDNSELDEVKFEQAMVENRIADLKAIFGNAHILESDQIPTDHAGIGSKVKLRDLDFMDEFEVRIVSSIEADPTRDLISNESPLGLALLGGAPNEEIAFVAPEGKKRYKILSISK
jgi:transcription elongation factor GreA